MVTLYNVVSKDWFIADKNGSEDFIPNELWPTTLEIFQRFDSLVMGRKTYETLQSYGKELLKPFEKLAIKKVVISRNENLDLTSGYAVADTAENALTSGRNVLVSSGPTLNNYLLEKKLVDRVLLHQVPATLGEGIPVFEPRYRNLLILESKSNLGLVIELNYKVG